MTTVEHISDLELLDRTAGGDRDAYGQLVARHQSAASAVAYNIVGDLAGSEDVAQEAFVAAWKQLDQLQDRTRFRPWVCGIARNMALSRLRSQRKVESLEAAAELADGEPTPADHAMAREEHALVWSALESLPSTYREPLILFYREEQSVALVAAALELSEDAVKQRLSRGREMLRVQVAATVESALRRSRPGPILTAAVLGALPGLVTSSALAATASATAKASAPVVKAAISASLGAWLAGLIGGLLGPALGTWATFQTAHYQRQRDFLRRWLITFAILFVVFVTPYALLGLGIWTPNKMGDSRWFLLLQLLWMGTFYAVTIGWSVHLGRVYRRVQAEEFAAGSPALAVTPLRRWLARWEGREWRSRQTLLGLPLIHINFTAPEWSVSGAPSGASGPSGLARGWIALGTRAHGILIAVGSIAYGGIAIGGVSCGLLAVGGASIGIFPIGGLAAGIFPFGGAAIGLGAFGGLAVGWWANGGAALAWRAAQGGLAWAHDFAVGGQAFAVHANDAAAREFIESHGFFRAADRITRDLLPAMQGPWFIVGVIAISALLPVLLWRIGYRQKN